MYRKTLQTSVAAAALFAFAAPFAGPATAAGNTVVNGKSQVKLAITGQLSRTVQAVDDGNTTNIHHTSQAFSGNRLRFIGTAKAWESLTIGTRIEFQFNNRTSGGSGNFKTLDTAGEGIGTVKTRDEDTGDGSGIDQRYQDITFAGSWGKLYVGKGDTAGNGTTEVDYSGTIIAMDPAVDGGFGGSFFLIDNLPAGTAQDPNLNGGLAGPRASTVFSSFDGLSRTQRVRYDSPSFGGLKVSVGYNQGPIPDAALRYKASFGGTKVSAAIAWSNRDSASATLGHQINGSGSVLHSSGLNLTVAAGTRELEAAGRSDPSFWYVKVGYKAKLVDAGTTNFYFNYQNTEDLVNFAPGFGSDATAWGFGVVQILKDYATELFAAFSIADFDDTTTSSYEDLTTGLVGARLKF